MRSDALCRTRLWAGLGRTSFTYMIDRIPPRWEKYGRCTTDPVLLHCKIAVTRKANPETRANFRHNWTMASSQNYITCAFNFSSTLRADFSVEENFPQCLPSSKAHLSMLACRKTSYFFLCNSLAGALLFNQHRAKMAVEADQIERKDINVHICT